MMPSSPPATATLPTTQFLGKPNNRGVVSTVGIGAVFTVTEPSGAVDTVTVVGAGAGGLTEEPSLGGGGGGESALHSDGSSTCDPSGHT